MMKRGGLRQLAPALAFIMLLAFIYLGIPAKLNTTPTGLASAPEWTGATNTLNVPADGTLEVNLDNLFTSEARLTYLASRADKISTRISESTLTIDPMFGFVGERTITLYASDGETITRKRIKIIVTAEPGQQQESAVSPSEIKIEPSIEAILASEETADAIIILRDTVPFTFSATAAKQIKKQLLEQRKQAVDQAQDALLARVNDVPENAITGAVIADEADFELIQEYETINALAVKLTRTGLAKLRNDPSVAQILLDRPFSAVLGSSIPVIDADDVWNMTVNSTNITGKGEGICVLDTGIDLTHPAFTGKIIGGHDYVNEDASPQDDAGNSHGTHVSGIAAGNSSSVKGVAPDANIIPLKVCNSGNSCTASDILAGIDYCNNNSVILNATAISGSLSDGGQYASGTCPTLFDSALNTSNTLGIIPVFASGNNGYTNGISYPACSPYAISAGSTSDGDSVSSFSNRGGDRLDVLAPGESVTSAAVGGGTSTLSGTSMSTPHASGAVALIQQNQRAQNKPILALAEMRQLLKETGRQAGSWHRLDVYAAIVKLNQNYTINITENSVTNATPPKAKVAFKDSTDLSGFVECSELKHNFIHVNSEQCPQYNKSAHIILEGLPGINATPRRNGAPCPAETCQNATFNNGTLEFDVTSFTNYTGESYFGTDALVDACAVINDSTSLTANVISNTTCFTINASNLYLNCSGFSISYGMDGTQNHSYGIFANNKTNLTIRDCTITDINNGSRNNIGINFTNVNDSLITNVSIQTNGTADNNGIMLWNSSRNNIDYSTIRTRGTSLINVGIYVLNASSTNVTNTTIITDSNSFGYGILIDITSHNSTALNNTISTSGPGSTNPGIGVFATMDTRIFRNIITTNGTFGNTGISLGAHGNRSIVENNTIVTSGNQSGSSGNTGIALTTTMTNIIRYNTIRTTGLTINNAIILQGSAHNNTFTGNNISASGNNTYAIRLAVTNETAITDTILTDPSDWIEVTAPTIRVNLTNTTFLTINGSIQYTGVMQINGTENITRSKFNISSNQASANSTNLSLLNTTARITLFNTNLFDPKPMIDYEDDGVYTDCPLNTCTEISFNATGDNAYTFDVTQFTGYSAGDATIFSCNVTINTSSVLTQNITAEQTCLTIGSDNLTFNCRGNTITFNTIGTSNTAGITAEGRTNITIQDCIILDGNATGGTTSMAINLSKTNYSRIVNNTLVANSTVASQGIRARIQDYRNIIENNTIIADGNAGAGTSLNTGIDANTNSSENNITGNTITANGYGASNFNRGILIDHSNNTVRNNTLRTNGNGASNIAVSISGPDNFVIGNTIITNGTIRAHGIQMSTNGNQTLIANNTIVTSGNESGADGNYGIYFIGTGRNTAQGNRITATGRSINHGIYITSGAVNHTITGNNITTDGNQSYAIAFTQANYSLLADNLLTNPVEWIDGQAGGNSQNNITNITFTNANGSIRFQGLIQFNGSQNITRARLFIRQNQAYVNSTNLSLLNLSARVTLQGIGFSNPQPESDFEDDGTFAPCPAGICNEISYNSITGTYVFDVTQFTTHQSGETSGGGGSSSGAAGGASGGGGGGDSKKSEEQTTPTTEQPAQDLSRFLNENPTEQEIAETAPINEEIKELEPIIPPEIKQQQVTKSIATLYYLASFISLAVLVVLWAAWHRKK